MSILSKKNRKTTSLLHKPWSDEYKEFVEVDRIRTLRGSRSLLIGIERVRACEEELEERGVGI
jgi:hypothetical protein